MAVTIHLVNVALIRKTLDGRLYFPSNSKPIAGGTSVITHKDAIHYTEEHRIIADPTIPNSATYPNLKDYLNLEAGSGFQFAYMDQYNVITQKLV